MERQPRSWRRRLLIAFFVLGPLGLLPYFFYPKPPDVPDVRPVCVAPYCQEPMVAIPAGTFLMGAQSADPDGVGYDAQAGDDEGPPREVTVSAFFLDRSEVSAAEYADCVTYGGCRMAEVATGGYMSFGAVDRESLPMNGVTWEGARQYCQWIRARLPTEAEWERAARGDDGRPYPWGEDAPPCDGAHGGDPFEACPSDRPHPVSMHVAPSPYGAVALSGGVWEWVADWYLATGYPPGPATDPGGPPTGDARAQRGGGFQSEYPAELRTTYRGGLPPGSRLADLGFRCARDGDSEHGAASHHEMVSARLRAGEEKGGHSSMR